MIRLILIIIILLIFLIYSIFDAIVNYFVKKVDKDLARKMTHSVVRCVLFLIKQISGVKVHVKGIENLDESTPLLIVANHRGFFDVITGYQLLKRPCGVVGKDSFKKIPLINYWMKRIDCFFLDRKDMRSGISMIIDSVEKLKSGISIWIFPEGTRNKNDDPQNLLEFKAGAFKIAEKSDCKILPMAFYGTEKIFENQKPMIRPGDVYINIGKAYKLSDLSDAEKKEPGEYCKSIVTELLKEVACEKG